MRGPGEPKQSLRILAVSDVESQYYYDYYKPGKLDEFDLIIACGDLKRRYLEFLITMAHCPVFYVHGNHDDALDKEPPGGCVCLEDKIYVYKGVRILGLGGSYRYRDGGHMFTEGQMARRVRRLWFQLWRHGGFDILVTHAPGRDLGDLDSLAHRGFECFVKLVDKYRPRYFIHGHVHLNYGANIPRSIQRDGTTVINAFDHYSFDFDTDGEG